MEMPSTTTTWATIAGLLVGSMWGMLDTFTDLELAAGMVGTTTALASGIVGKLVKERRYVMTKRDNA
jgi:hypothetical protein